MDGQSTETKSCCRRVISQFLAVIIKNLLQINFGFILAIPTVIIPDLKQEADLTLNEDQLSWIGSLFLITLPIGCIASGLCAAWFGRKNVMVMFSLPMSAAWWYLSKANTIGHLYGAIILHGILNGLQQSAIIIYDGEVCEPQWRGTISSTTVLLIFTGIFLQFFIGNYVEWRKAAFGSLFIPLAAFILMWFIPESPHWLMGKGRTADAEKSLRWLRGWTTPDAVKDELEELKEFVERHKRKSFSWKLYFEAKFLKPFFFITIAFIFGHFRGDDTLQTYAVEIFEELKSPVGSYILIAIQGFLQLFAAFLFTFTVRYIGRRLMLIVTTVGTGICLVSVAIVGEGWLATTLLLVAIFLSCTRMFPWVLIGEAFSFDVRSVGSSIVTCMFFSVSFLLNKTWYLIIHPLTLHGVLAAYGCVSLVCAVFYFFLLPETEGKTLEEVEAHYTGRIDLTKAKKGHTTRGDTGRDDTGRDDTGRDDTGRDDTGLDETGQDDTGRDETGQDDTGRDDTGDQNSAFHEV